LYRPWAKVRREKFFHQHTVIDGDSLDYHGNPKSILIGQLISIGLIVLVYARTLSVTLAATAAIVLCLVVPFAMQRSLRFRLYNTSFRGLRFGFKGSVKQAYLLAMVPVAIIGITFLTPIVLGEEAQQNMPSWYVVATALVGFAVPVVHAVWRRYAISYAHYGSVLAKTNITVLRFLGTYFFAGLIAALAFATLVGIAAISGIGAVLGSLGKSSELSIVSVISLLGAIVLGAIVFSSFQPVLTAMLQNVCWNKETSIINAEGEEVAKFECDLSVSRFALLHLKNTLLTILTVGLYRPFAACAVAKAKLEAIRISDFRFIDQVSANTEAQNNAIGSEATSVLDFDFSL
jgi:uncharacterized membrane protein YjgN (DUF898 family)